MDYFTFFFAFASFFFASPLPEAACFSSSSNIVLFLEFLLTRSFLDIAIVSTFQTAPYLNETIKSLVF